MSQPHSQIDNEKRISKAEMEQIMSEIETHPLTVGEKWNLISLQWWDSVEKAMNEESFESITSIDNSSITTIGEHDAFSLSPNLREQMEYITVPSTVFAKLVHWFGLENQARDVIERAVVEDTRSGNIIEVYPILYTVLVATDRTKVARIKSRNETVGDLRKKICTELGIDSYRFLLFIEHHSGFECMNDIKDEDDVFSIFSPDHDILVDLLDENGKGSIKSWEIKDSYHVIEHNLNETQFQRGVCGLINLGHTCFMASALQCISNTPEITEYFLSNRYQADINVANPLGTQGKLAHAYGTLVKALWSGQYERVIMRQFKMTIGKFAPLFAGYSRQDAQELLAALLDGLHEDLNRIKQKPYIEEKEHPEGTSQKEIADEAWANYRARNDSVIVDNVHGQLRSTLVCPHCAKVSIKFDPFCFLSVPVPVKDVAVSLVDCINLFTQQEQLSEQDSWYCPRCKDHVLATKKLDIWRLPPIVIVHLKRFQSTRWSRDKVQTPVDLPGTDFNLGEICANESEKAANYDLVAVSFHSGRLADGHYSASALNGDQWYYFADALVNKCKPPYGEPSTSPYLLVYRRKE